MRHERISGQTGTAPSRGLLIDMHVHATSSPDASMSEEELAGTAVSRGLGGLGFVAHVDFHPLDYCADAFSPDGYERAYRLAMSRHGDSLRLMQGQEVGEPHLFGARVLEAIGDREYDFVTGAVHWVGDLQILEPGPFEGGDPMGVVAGYYEELLEMVRRSDIDVAAHVGIFRRGMARAGLDTSFDETEIWPGLLRDLADELVGRDIALEINTSGLRRPEAVTYPAPAFLDLFLEAGGKSFTLGSDTHSEPWVFYGLEDGAALLRNRGVDSVLAFERRIPVRMPLP